MLDQEIHHRRTIAAHLLWHQHHATPGQQLGDGLDRGIEGKRSIQRNPCMRIQRSERHVFQGLPQVDDRVVFHHDALGRTGGARGVDDVGQAAWVQRGQHRILFRHI